MRGNKCGQSSLIRRGSGVYRAWTLCRARLWPGRLSADGRSICSVSKRRGRLTMPIVIRRLGLRKVVFITGFACLVSSPPAAWHDHPFAVVAWLSVLGFAVSGLYPSVNAHAGDRFPTAGSTMFAAFNSAALLGALTGPIAFGMAADLVGLRWALASTAAAPLVWMTSLALGVRSESRKEARFVSHG